MKTRILTLLLSFFTLAGAFGQSALSVNSSTGAIVGPVSAATFKTNNSIQPLDSDLTSWATITRGTGVDTAAAINTGSAGGFILFNGAGGTPTSLVGTNISGTGASFTAGHATDAASLSISGQTGLLSLSGLTSTNRIKTVRDAADTILELGGSYTPTGTWTNMILVTPALGTPSALVGTNISGTGANFTAGHVTANANLTGDVTSVGNAATVANIPVTATFATDDTVIPLGKGGWTEYFVTGSDFATSSTTAVDVTGLVTGTLSASTRYEFETDLILLNAADVTGLKIAFHGGGTGTAATVTAIGVINTTNANSVTSISFTAIDTLSPALVSYSAGQGAGFCRGFFTTNSTGTITFSVQTAKVVSNTATVRVGSVLRVRKAHT